MNYPARQQPPEPVWSRFSLDPRESGDMRASDGDRENAREVISEAYAQGQLSHEEYTERLGATLQAQHLGQLVPLLNDIQMVQPNPATPAPLNPAPPTVPRPTGALSKLAVPPSSVTRTALFVIGVTNLVWVATSLGSGRLNYYWPMWPALGMAIMVLSTMLFGDAEKQRAKALQREQESERHRKELE